MRHRKWEVAAPTGFGADRVDNSCDRRDLYFWGSNKMDEMREIFSQTSFTSLVMLMVIFGLAGTLLIAWQVTRQGWRRVGKTYGVLGTLALGAFVILDYQPQELLTTSVAQSETAELAQNAPAISARSVAQEEAQTSLDGIEERLSKGRARPEIAELIAEPVFEPSVNEALRDPKKPRAIVEALKPYIWLAFLAVFVLYMYRVHPDKFKFERLKALIGLSRRWIRPKRSSENELGSSDFATYKELKRWLKPQGKYDTILPIQEIRGSGGILAREGNLVIPIGERNRNILIVAKTGSGKTTKLILPIVYGDCICRHRSSIIIDSKAEMWAKCAAMTKKLNPEKRLLLFNPLDKARSLSWNILAKIESDTDCKLIANSIIMATDEPGARQDSPFFRNSALQVLNAMMVGLLDDPSDRLSMPRIHELINKGMHGLCDWLEAHPKAIRTTKAFVELARSGSQNADTIMSELSMRIQAWDLTAIRATTFLDEMDVESIIKEPTLLVVELRESELKMLRPLANVIVVELLRFLTKFAEECHGQTLPRPVGLIIDEFASALGRLPDIHIKLNTLRSRNCSIVAAIQSIGQLKGNYGEDWESVLSGFSTKIFMPSLDYMDSEWASKESGQMTIRFRTSSKGANRKITDNFAHHNVGLNEQVQQRQVLTPGEVGRPPSNEQTFFLPETPVFQGHLVPYYKMPEMNSFFTDLSAAEHEVRLRTEPIEVIEQLPEPVIKGEGQGGEAQLTDEQIWNALEEMKLKKLDWENTQGDARTWWEAFEQENKTRIALVLKVAEEIAKRNATITDFFLAYIYSNTDNIQATLAYLDYSLHKQSQEAAAANGESPPIDLAQVDLAEGGNGIGSPEQHFNGAGQNGAPPQPVSAPLEEATGAFQATETFKETAAVMR